MSLSQLETAGDAGAAALAASLHRAATVKAACAAVVRHLAIEPGLMPSLYLERGGRLRCQAVSRYWQVFDGMPPGAGVIGTTFATGLPTVIRDPAGSPRYLEAVPSVQSEVCVPIHLDGSVIGVLNVESEEQLEDSVQPRLERCAAAVAERIAQLGGMPAERRPERLARHAAELAALVEREDILALALDAACDVADMESALIALGGQGSLSVAAVRGPHTAVLRGLSASELVEVAHWVRASTSVYTIGEPAGRGFSGHEPFRRAGAEALIALPLTGGSGFLLLVDSAPIALETEEIELLELLAAQTTSALATAAALGELRERAASDPLTGLGHHAGFHAALGEACARPERRGRLALLVLDLDGFKHVNDTRGHQEGDRLLRQAAQSLRGALRADDLLFRIGGDEFAALVTVGEPAEAEAAAERLRRAVRDGGQAGACVGVALLLAGEDSAGLFARADAALYEAKRAGGDRTVVDAAGYR